MSKKIMKKIIPSLLHINSNKGPKQQQQQQPPRPWQWRPSSCNHHPETLSFRCSDNNAADANIIFKTHNSIFHHQDHHLFVSDSCLTSPSNSDIHPYNYNTDTVSSSDESLSSFSASVETIIRGAVKSSDRLFFEPEPRSTSSILLLNEEAEAEAEEEEGDGQPVVTLPFKESVALALESEDPYWDFKESMREMVESLQGLKKNKEKQEQDWESLEELLGWYLRMNKRMNHGIIVGAFVDLLLGLAAADEYDEQDNNNTIRRRSSSSSSSSYSSADSCFSSPRSIDADEDFNHDS